jgi:ribosome-binding protein aMBF1 (putative translation factor)
MREARENAGMSQRELSQKLGKKSTYVFKLESGEIRRIDVVELSEYLKLLGSSLPDFLADI